LGLVSPSRFLPIAEDTGLIEPIGEWAIRAACIQSQAWQAAGFAPLRMAVNLSGRQFRDRRFIETIARILRDTDFPPLQLDLELTEDIVMEDAQATVAILRELNGMGLRFSIDDFGTGYSSLSHLKRFPIHVLKIDPSFVRDMTSQATDEAIVKSIIALSIQLLVSFLYVADVMENCHPRVVRHSLVLHLIGPGLARHVPHLVACRQRRLDVAWD